MPGSRGMRIGNAQLGRDEARNRRTHAAERYERELARVVAALDRDGAHSHHHIGREHAQDAPGRLDLRYPERRGHAGCHRLARLGACDRHRAIEQGCGVEVAQQHERVGERRRAAAAVIAGGSGIGARALRPTLRMPPSSTAAMLPPPAPMVLDVDGVRAQRMARDAQLRFEQRRARQHRHVGARSAGIEGDKLLNYPLPRRRDDARR